MGKLILLNDVSTEVDEVGFLVGDSNPPASTLGQKQSEAISSFIYEKTDINVIVCSDADRIQNLIHKIRMKSKDQRLTKVDARRLQALRERSFGVLNGTQYPLDSAIFQHSRILPENGESVMQCRSRLMTCIGEIAKKSLGHTVLVASHPFACQLICNVVLKKGHTLVTKFWQQKGSFIVLNFEAGKFGIKWSFQSAYNSFVDQPYTQDEVYSELLGAEGSCSSKGSN